MEKTILKTDGVMKAGNEVFARGMKNLVLSTITKDNVVRLALFVMIGTAFVVHDLTTHGYGADIETENKKVKVSFKPREYYMQGV